MSGDFTSVPLRPDDAWTGARMQQGRVLSDTDWNLNLDAGARATRRLGAAAIGPVGVEAGTSGFQIGFDASGELTIDAGDIWVAGLEVSNPVQLAYAAQAAIAEAPSGGTALVYLDVFEQEVQAAEDAVELLDPALDGIDTTTRTRTAWRVRVVGVDATSCAGAVPSLPVLGVGTGLLDVVRTVPPAASDPCAPPDDPRGRLPDGLLRIEVLDSGTEATARFGWSYTNGSDAVSASVSGTTATLAPSPSVEFFTGDLVEVSTLLRRADRLPAGPLFTVTDVTPGAGGAVVTLSAPSSVSGAPDGLCLRRWDGEVVGAASQTAATILGADVGVGFTARPGSYLAGDWWGVRVRGSAADAIEERAAAAPDGTEHWFAALAVVDLTAKVVLSDCRPSFPSLTQLRGGTCTATAFPGDDLQLAVDSLPPGGGVLCLAAGDFAVAAPIVVTQRSRVVIHGVGPATIVHTPAHETVWQFVDCADVSIEAMSIRSGTAANVTGRVGEQHQLGAVTFAGCTDATVRACEISCPDNTAKTQTAISLMPSAANEPGRSLIVDNRLQVGDQQVGILAVSPDELTITGNEIRLGPAPVVTTPPRPHPIIVNELARFVGSQVLAADAKNGHVVALANDASLRVAGSPQLRALADEFGRTASPKSLERATPRQGLERFARRALLAPASVSLSRPVDAFLTAARSTRCLAQGIVVAGVRANVVRIRANLISGAIEGVHVGLSAAAGSTFNAGDVVCEQNTIGCAVPYFWNRARHAIYVGSVERLSLHDNTASLVRVGGTATILAAISATPVEAVRIHGRTGAWLSVRGVNLTGPFSAGVAITDLTPASNAPRLHYVSDVLNSAGGAALSPTSVAHDRCVP